MSKRARRVAIVVTVLFWTAWLSMAWMTEFSQASGLGVAESALRLATVISSIFLSLGFIVAPALKTARVWHEIGIKEQQKHCDVCPVASYRSGRLADVIPFQSLTRTEN